jgi:hypothetical protein
MINRGNDLGSLVQAARQVRPPEGTADHTWRRITTSLAAGTAPLVASTAQAAAGTLVLTLPKTAAQLGWKWVIGSVVGVASVAGVVGVVSVGSTPVDRQPSHRLIANHSAEVVARPVTAAARATSQSVDSSDEGAVSTKATPPITTTVVSSGRGVPSENMNPARSDQQFERELRLIQQAKAAVDNGNQKLALALLDRHNSEFPDGVFTTERDALRLVIVCRAGTTDQIRSRARNFIQSNPRALSVDRVRRACMRDEPAMRGEAIKR